MYIQVMMHFLFKMPQSKLALVLLRGVVGRGGGGSAQVLSCLLHYYYYYYYYYYH